MKKIILLIALNFFIQSCSSFYYPKESSLSEQLEYCLSLYNSKDYYHASLYFSKLRLYVRATEYEDKVDYYLGMSNYHSKKYNVAISSFRNIFSRPTHSPYKRKAFFMIGMCYYKLSPQYAIDQLPTEIAIQQFQAFINNYPPSNKESVNLNLKELREIILEIKDDSIRYARYKDEEENLIRKLNHIDTVKLVEEYIFELRNKLAKKLFASAQHYMFVENYNAAEIYFDKAISKFSDTNLYEKFLIGKIQSLVLQKKWRECLLAIDKYQKVTPNKKQKIISDYKKQSVYGIEHEDEEKQYIKQKHQENVEPFTLWPN